MEENQFSEHLCQKYINAATISVVTNKSSERRRKHYSEIFMAKFWSTFITGLSPSALPVTTVSE